MLEIASLGSGSKGNATLIRWPGGVLLIDCGFSAKETLKRLERFGVDAGDLIAILVTHEHSDHASGVGTLSRRLSIPFYATHGTFRGMRDVSDDMWQCICSHTSFSILELNVTPYPVPHDANEPVQFVFEYQGKKQGVLTDVGSITPYVLECLAGVDGLLLECNHDWDMLMNGPYPFALKQRVSSDIGHLNNQQSAQLLSRLDQSRLQCLVLAHISEKNNHPDHVIKAITPHVKNAGCKVVVAEQNQGFDWCAL